MSMISSNAISIYEMFRQKVHETPNKVAVRFNDVEITYEQLNTKILNIENYLYKKTFKTGDSIALNLESYVDTIAAVIGLIKAGGNCIILDSRFPQSYNDSLMDTNEVKFIFTDSYEQFSNKSGLKILVLSDVAGDIDLNDTEAGMSGKFTYVYTGLENEKLTLNEKDIIEWLKFNEEKLKVSFDKMLYTVSKGLGVMFPIWLGCLISGGTICIDSFNMTEQLTELSDYISRNEIQSIVLSLSDVVYISSNEASEKIFSSSIKNLITLGEDVFNAASFKEYLKSKGIRWHNYFNFPETQIITGLTEYLSNGVAVNGHAGKPIQGIDAYVMDESGDSLMNIGIPGVLFLSGNNTSTIELYKEYNAVPGKVLYKAGYRAQWLSDGKIALLGRYDEVVSVGGCRISAQYIEKALIRSKLADECAVICNDITGQRENPIAYITSREEVSYTKINESLKSVLPDCMLPLTYVKLASMPYLMDGSLDRDALIKLDLVDSKQIKDLEDAIAGISDIGFAAVLSKEAVPRRFPMHLKDLLTGRISSNNKSSRNEETSDINSSETINGEKPLALSVGEKLIIKEDDPKTLVEVIERAAQIYSERKIIYINNDGSESQRKYKSLLEDASKIFTGLKEMGVKPQDKVIFQFDKNDDFITAFWGCILAGAVPVPVALPKNFAEPNNETNALYNVWEILDKPLVLTGKDSTQLIAGLQNIYDFGGLVVKSVEDMRNNEPGTNWHHSLPGDPTLIVFTSGSTGKPKGVVLTNRNIVNRCICSTQGNGYSNKDTSMNWMPLEHVGGIVSSHIRDTFLGIDQVHVSPSIILQNPIKWVEFVDRFKVSITWAPNFAYGLINNQAETIKKGKWDLSSMRFIINAGEAVLVKTIKKFVELLSQHGLPLEAIHPAYGMSETSSGIGYSKGFRPDLIGDDEKDVDLGPPLPGASFRIVDNTGKILCEDMTGSIEVTAPTVFAGYYKQPELTREVMTEDDWYKTGDLGYIHNGLLIINGRAKDVIIINGANYNNSEIESAADEVEGVETSYTAACAVKEFNSDTEKIAIFFNSKSDEFDYKLNQINQIRKKVMEKVGVKVDYIIPVEKEEIPKTNIGKIQRSKLSGLFEKGHFDGIQKQIDLALENDNTLPSWFHKKYWTKKSAVADVIKNSEKITVIFDDESGVGSLIRNKLEVMGTRCVLVKKGSEFSGFDEAVYTINYKSEDDFKKLFTSIEAKNVGDLVFIFSYIPNESKIFDGEHLKEQQTLGIYSLRKLVKALDTENIRAERLFAITAKTQKTAKNEIINFDMSGMSGFLKCLDLECKWMECHHIDVEAVSISQDSECILNEINSLSKDTEVAYRKGMRMVPYLSEVDMLKETKKDIPVKMGEVYLVTGGLGGVGRQVSSWLLECCSAKLVILGYTKLPPREKWDEALEKNDSVSEHIKVLMELESISSDIIYVDGDVSDYVSLCDVYSRTQSKWGKNLTGVFHLAGTGYRLEDTENHFVAKETDEDFEKLINAKVYGSVNLLKLLQQRPESLFVAFSSTTAITGAPSFSAYAAANSFLEGLCHVRRNTCPNTYYISWSMWEDTGMSSGYPVHLVNSMQSKGNMLIPPKKAVNSLQLSLCTGNTDIIIGLDDSKESVLRYFNRQPSEKQIFKIYYTLKNSANAKSSDINERILKFASNIFRGKNTNAVTYKLEEMLFNKNGQIDYGKLTQISNDSGSVSNKKDLPETETEKRLLKMWQEVLGKSRIGINDNFFDLGGHSLNASTLIFRINKEFNSDIKLGEIFKCPTIMEIAKLIELSEKNKYSDIKPLEKQAYYQLSSAQKRLFILSQLESTGTGYNIPVAMWIEGSPDVKRFDTALNTLINRHEILRTSFEYFNGEPVQKVHDNIDFKVGYLESDEENVQTLVKSLIRPFDLNKAPLLRAALIKVKEDKHVLVLDIHHIISDGISMSILIKEFENAYMQKDLPELKLQYKDYAAWHNSLLETGELREQEEYWLNTFKGKLPILSMPIDFKRPKIRTYNGNTTEVIIPENMVKEFEILANKEGITPNTLAFSIYSLLISKYSGQNDIVIGSISAGRQNSDIEDMLGVFMNFLPIRISIDTESTFSQYVREVHQTTVKAYENQDIPFERIAEKAALQADNSRNPLFDTMLVYHNEFDTIGDMIIGGLKFSEFKFDNCSSALDFKLDIYKTGNQELRCLMEYNTDLFKQETVTKLLEDFKLITEKALDNQKWKISELALFNNNEELDIKEKRKLNTLSKSPVQLVIAATFTSEPVKDYIEWWSNKSGENLTVQFAGYNQVFQELLAQDSLISTNTGVNLLLVRFEDWIRNDNSNNREKLKKLENNYTQLTEALKTRLNSVPCFIVLFPVSQKVALNESIKDYIETMYIRLVSDISGVGNMELLDFRGLAEQYSISEIFDEVKDKSGHLPFSDEFYAAMGTAIAFEVCSYINPLIGKPEPFTAKELLKLPVTEKQTVVINREAYEAASNDTEEKLIHILEELLGIEKISVNDSFFELGGNSLKAATLISRIHKVFNVEIKLRDIFESKTIKELARYIDNCEINIYSSITSVELQDYYPVSSAQKRMYLLSMLEGTGTSYNIPGAMAVEGKLDIKRLQDTFKTLIKRHDALRTSIEMLNDEPVQRINETVNFEVAFIEQKESNVQQIVNSFIRPFDFCKAPLLRAALVKIEEEKYLLLFDMHHIISDGVSMALLMKEFAALYNGNPLPELRLQYKDFSVWQNKLYASGVLKQQEEYWLNRFAGKIPVLSLPTDFPRPTIQSIEGSSITFELDKVSTNKIKNIAIETGTSLYMILLASYNILLHKYTHQEDIVIGSPVAGRPHSDLENIIGVFVNTLAIRNYPKGDKTFIDFMNEVKENVFRDMENQDYPFEELANKLVKNGDPGRNPLFDTMFVMENMDFEATEINELKFSPFNFDSRTSKLDISLITTEENSQLSFTLEYCTKLFKKETMQKFSERYLKIINIVSQNPALKIADIVLLDKDVIDEVSKKIQKLRDELDVDLAL